jgi:seryl-tRNA synthetase
MPQNIVVGKEAEQVAKFLEKYSGQEAARRRSPASATSRRGFRAARTPSRRPDGPAMLDLKAIRREPAPVREALARRRDGSEERLDRALELDGRRRALLPEVESLRARQNEASKAIGAAKAAGKSAADAIASMQAIARQAKALGEELSTVDAELEQALASLPNPPDVSAADADEVLREVGESGRTGRDHLELAGRWVDMEAGARVAGSRFAFLRGDLVLLELALVRWGLEVLRGHGFEPVVPPVLVREEALFGTGFLPDTEQQIYRLADDPLYLAGTSEVPLARCWPARCCPRTSCPCASPGSRPAFRREPARPAVTLAACSGPPVRQGRDVLVRRAGRRPEEHERLLSIEEEILSALGIPFRVVNIAVDDLGSSAVKKYDCEAWLPGQGQFRELTSTSNTTDFQARRLNIRYRPGSGGPRFVHTLNGTAIAVGRTIIALLENGQQEDGTVAIPSVLHDWGAPPVISGGA